MFKKGSSFCKREGHLNVWKNNRMPSYELAVILNGMLKRPELLHVLKRNCEQMLQKGTVIRNIENLGHRELPYSMKSHGVKHHVGNYFLINFESPVSLVDVIQKDFQRDSDIIRNNVSRKYVEFRRPCLDGPCQFGEIPDPLHEKKIYRQKTIKTLKVMKMEHKRK